MLTNKVFEVVLQKDLPLGTKLIDCVWAMKKKSNGMLHGQMNAKGFKLKNSIRMAQQSAHQSQIQQLLESCCDAHDHGRHVGTCGGCQGSTLAWKI
jgi:hypothetical protein